MAVTVAANIDLSSPPPRINQSADAATSGANAVPQTFGDSLLSAAKTIADSGGTSAKPSRGAKPVEDDGKRPALSAIIPNLPISLIVPALPQPPPPTPLQTDSPLSVGDPVAAAPGDPAPDIQSVGATGISLLIPATPASVFRQIVSGISEQPTTAKAPADIDKANRPPVAADGAATSDATKIVSPAKSVADPIAPSVALPAAHGGSSEDVSRPGLNAVAGGVRDPALSSGVPSGHAGAHSPAVHVLENNSAPASVVASSHDETFAATTLPTTTTDQAMSIAVSAAVAATKPMSENPDMGHPALVDVHNSVAPSGTHRGQDTSAAGAKDSGAPKHPEKPTSVSAASQTASQANASGDQTQGDPTQRDSSSAAQPVVPAQASSNNALATNVHTAVAMTPSTPPASSHAAASAHVATVPAQVPATAPQPLINTAKLIQSVGQTEMRVGLRSEEFGNISIRTSSTRDLISTQISVDHSELANALSTHVPEMQTKLGGSQAANVQIDFSGQNAGQSGNMSNGSASDSHGARQQTHDQDSNNYVSSDARQFSPVHAAITIGDGGTRLDIRA
ncbi:MAG: hypothetical protein M3R43_09640 [Acidobacteriota bacterium]|nr:hypothetical protein [Acidobacteriota bacterium]